MHRNPMTRPPAAATRVLVVSTLSLIGVSEAAADSKVDSSVQKVKPPAPAAAIPAMAPAAKTTPTVTVQAKDVQRAVPAKEAATPLPRRYLPTISLQLPPPEQGQRSIHNRGSTGTSQRAFTPFSFDRQGRQVYQQQVTISPGSTLQMQVVTGGTSFGRVPRCRNRRR